MSFIDGTIGNKRNSDVHLRFTRDEKEKLEDMAASYNVDVSKLIREKLFGRTADYVKSEIGNAIEKVRNGYQKAAGAARNYLADPEDVYSMAYAQAQPGYGVNEGYR